MKSFLLIGQSNMAGRGFLHEVPPIRNDRIFMLRNGRWHQMEEPIHYDKPSAGIGPAASFAELFCRENPGKQIGLIPCAEGGSSIDEWSPDGILFRHAVSEARFAMETSELAGILWHQGETDSDSGKYKTYYQKFSAVIDFLRTELSAPDLPILIGGLGDYLGKTAWGASCTEYTLINQELQRFAETTPNCFFITAQALTPNPDGLHLNALSQRTFGIRYYEAYRQAKNILTPLPNENTLL